MKLKVLATLLLLPMSLVAQASHSVSLTWTASSDTGGTVNVYRSTSTCPTGSAVPSGFTSLATKVAAAGPYSDTTVGIGQFSYYVTTVVNGAESVPSNCISVVITPLAPTALVGLGK